MRSGKGDQEGFLPRWGNAKDASAILRGLAEKWPSG